MQETKVTHQLATNKEILALFYAWRLPDLGRHVGTLEQSTNPLVQLVYKAIQEGSKGLAAVAMRPCLERDLLDQVAAYEPPVGLLKMLEERRPGLADEFFEQTEQAAVMVLPFQPYFAGELPSAGCGHTCQHSVKATETPDGKGMYYHKQTARLWRSRMEGGLFMAKCDACYHERVWRLCQQIIRESEQYPADFLPLRAIELDNGKALQKLVNKARQWRQSHGVDFRYKALPQHGGRVLVIHNQPDRVGGEELPTSKQKLYDLLYQWADTPEDKRLSTSVGWGGSFQGVKGNGRKDEEAAPAGDDEQAAQHEPIEFVIESHSKLARILDYAHEITLHGKGRLDISPVELSFLMDDAGIKYGVTSGAARLAELRANFTHKVHPENQESGMCLMRENKQQEPAPLAAKREPAPLNTAVFGGAS